MSFLLSLKTEKTVFQSDFLATKIFFSHWIPMIGINLFGNDKLSSITPLKSKNTHENFYFGPWFSRSEPQTMTNFYFCEIISVSVNSEFIPIKLVADLNFPTALIQYESRVEWRNVIGQTRGTKHKARTQKVFIFNSYNSEYQK